METNSFEILRPLMQGAILALIPIVLAVRYVQSVTLSRKKKTAFGRERNDVTRNPSGADEEMVWLGLSGQPDEGTASPDELGLLSGPHDLPEHASRRFI